MRAFKTILCFATTGLLAPVMAAPSEVDASALSDFIVSGDMTFEGQAFKDGPNVTFTGTAQGWYKHVRELNPKYDEDFADWLAKQNASWKEMEKDIDDSLNALNGTSAAPLVERKQKHHKHHKHKHHPKCQAAAPGEAALTWYAKEGIRYLHGTNAVCTTPNWDCQRVSCDENAGIFMCDDNHSANKAPCDRVAHLAKIVVKKCSFYAFPDRMTRGTMQSGHGWYVRVNAGGC